MSKRYPVYYHVAPRYTPGSPAQVNFETAQRVADQERAGYDRYIQEREHDNPQEPETWTGLDGIVEEREERSDCWIVTDMLTGRRFVRMFPYKPMSSSKSLENRKFRLHRKYGLPVETS